MPFQLYLYWKKYAFLGERRWLVDSVLIKNRELHPQRVFSWPPVEYTCTIWHLTHCGLVTPNGDIALDPCLIYVRRRNGGRQRNQPNADIDLGQHWLGYWLINDYLDKCDLSSIRSCGIQISAIFNGNTKDIIHPKMFENHIYKITAPSVRVQWVKLDIIDINNTKYQNTMTVLLIISELQDKHKTLNGREDLWSRGVTPTSSHRWRVCEYGWKDKNNPQTNCRKWFWRHINFRNSHSPQWI